VNRKFKILFLAILIFGAFFRFYGLNWDDNWHLHPDERFLTMVATAIKWPVSFSQYLDTSVSPLNPHNAGFGFYVYGTWPVFLVKALAEWLGKGDYYQLTLVGRQLSAVFDLGILVLVFLITRRLLKNPKPALLAASFYGLMVLPIQLSHFFAVDPYLVFFLTLSFYIIIYLIELPVVILFVFLGLSFGLAVSAKVAAVLFVPIIALGFLVSLLHTRRLARLVIGSLIFTLVGFFTVRLTQPYLFANGTYFDTPLNPKVLANWAQLKSFENPDAWYPPGVQWINTGPYLYPLANLTLWGLGLPLAAIALLSLPYVLLRYRRHLLTLGVIWILSLFAYQGIQFAKPMRYFYPLYPFLAVTSGVFIYDLIQKTKHSALHFSLILALVLVWPVAFVSIYSRPHSRVLASDWILKNIPPGSALSCEHWDDCLPLGGPGPYTIIEYPLYNPDTPEKWQDMNAKLAKTDYILLTSNRLYGSITSVPDRYPITYRFYQKLFNGSLGFKKIAEFTSRPNLPLPKFTTCLTPPKISYGTVALPSQECPLLGLSFVDDYADETFTVYDHPKILIFQKIKQ